ncbi:DoxX family protein [Longispora albida]|uniref:DoxX family protein n=1 Tax=Longispora albida TaxID=203523 RepID=UPI000364618F|nr:MauE/DoxX family redox-associated membrane protein [Longispora albida]
MVQLLDVPVAAPVSRWNPIFSTICRLLLAGVWLWAGGSKITDLSGSVRAVNAYELLPPTMAQIVGAALPFVEVTLGLLMLAGLFTRQVALVSIALLSVFVFGIISAWVRGLQIDCGCFSKGGALGEGESPNYFWETLRDIGFMAAAGFLVLRPRTWFSLDGFLAGTPAGSADEPRSAEESTEDET